MRNGPGSSRATGTSTGTRLREESTPPTKPSIAPPSHSELLDPEQAAVIESPLTPFHEPAPTLSYGMVLVVAGAALGLAGLLGSTLSHEGNWASSGPWWLAVATLVFSLSMAVVITLSFARRLDALAQAARRLAFGRTSPGAEPPRGDAIAGLARCLTRMSERIADLAAELERVSEQEQGRLDTLVRERTRDLSEENEDLRRVFGDTKGMLSVDPQGKLVGQASSVIPRWLGAPPGSDGRFWEYFEQASPGAGARFQTAWRELMQRPAELDLRRLPRTLAVTERYLAVEYRAVRDGAGELRRVLVVLSDISIPEPDPATPS